MLFPLIIFALLGLYTICVILGITAVIQFRRVLQVLRDSETNEDEKAYLRQDRETWSFMRSLLGVFVLFPFRLAMLVPVFFVGSVVGRVYLSFYHVNEDDSSRNIMYDSVISRLAWAVLMISGISSKDYMLNENNEAVPLTHKAFDTTTGTIVSNHIAMLDILYFISRVQPSFISKRSVKDAPVVGDSAVALGSIFVDRADPESRNSTLKKIAQRQSKLVNDKQRPLLIFPEGTTTAGCTLLPFKRGAFESEDAVVTPVVLAYKLGNAGKSLFIPSFDVIDIQLYLPLLLANVGIVHLYACWCDPIKRSKGQNTTEYIDQVYSNMTDTLSVLIGKEVKPDSTTDSISGKLNLIGKLSSGKETKID